MMRARRRIASLFDFAGFLCLLGLGAASLVVEPPARAETPAQRFPDGPERAAFLRICNGCHSAETVLGRRNTPKYWDREIEHMIDRGAQGTPDDFEKIAAYLSRNFAYVPGTVNLPDGPGKPELIRICGGCHAPDIVVTRDGHEGTRSRWYTTIDRMMRRGAKATDTEFDLIDEYLTANFGYIPVTSNLPEGPGKEAVDRTCGPCHGVTLFNGRHSTREGWSATITNMMRRGARVTPQEFELMADYFAKYFGPDRR